MYYTTGLNETLFDYLLEQITLIDPRPQRSTGRPQALSLALKLEITLTYLRQNRVQCELAEAYGVHQTTISDVIITYTPLVATALQDYIPTADNLHDTDQLVIDGTLVPCWSWKTHREDYSGKHKTTGLNLQVASTIGGQMAWISDPTPGATHDTTALRQSGLLDTPDPVGHIGDKGFQGLGMITPVKKKPSWDHIPQDIREFNTEVSRIRSVVERKIAHLKDWKILKTDYRRPHRTHPETITAVIGLVFLKESLP